MGEPTPKVVPEPAIERRDVPTPVIGLAPEQLKPLASGRGVLIAEPEGDPGLRAFGAGCARWLHLNVGGRAEFGKTPSYSTVRNLAHETHLGHLRLSRSHLPAARRCLGVTHVALGSVRGSAQKCVLEYQLYDTKSGRRVASVRESGALPVLVKALPKIADRLATSIGGRAEAPKIVETADELKSIGRLPWAPPTDLPDDQHEFLVDIGFRTPLGATMLAFNRGAASDPNTLFDLVEAAAQMPGLNAMTLNEVCVQAFFLEGGSLEPLAGPVAALLKRNPDSHLLSQAAASISYLEGDFKSGNLAAERSARASQGPFGWSFLATAYTTQSRRIRQGRTSDLLSPEEASASVKLSTMAAQYRKRAVAVDAQSTGLWISLSSDAAFAGDLALAENALKSALTAEAKNPLPDSPSVFEWGMQLYHPKWVDNVPAALKLANRAVQEAQKAGASWPTSDRVDVALRIAILGERALANKVATTEDERAQVAELLQGHAREVLTPNARPTAPVPTT